MIQTRARMQMNNLIVFDGQIVARSLQVSCLHEKSGHERFSNVKIVITTREVRAGSFQAKPIHYP